MTDSMRNWLDWAARGLVMAVCVVAWQSYTTLVQIEREVDGLTRTKQMHWEYLRHLKDELADTRHATGLPPSPSPNLSGKPE